MFFQQISHDGLIEFISCHTDTLMIVRNADSVRVYGILSDLIGESRK